MMEHTTIILGIAGSLRRASYNRAALRAAQQLVSEDATLEIFELDGIPGFNQDDEAHPPAKVVELKARVRAADAILFVTPEYNYSVPGVLKNVIDWASRPYGENAWNGKPVAVMGGLRREARHGAGPISFAAGVCLFEYVSHQPTGSNDCAGSRAVRCRGNPARCARTRPDSTIAAPSCRLVTAPATGARGECLTSNRAALDSTEAWSSTARPL
jgi:hypothetical protein